MSFLKRIASFLSAGSEKREERDVHWEYVQCSRCGERIPVRVDLRNELTTQYEGGEGAYYARKGVVGTGRNRCFETIELDLFFNDQRQLVSRYITGGEFVTKEEYYAQEGD